MAKRLVTDAEIQKLIDHVDKLDLGNMCKVVNVLRKQKRELPEIEVRFLEALENEIKRRNNK